MAKGLNPERLAATGKLKACGALGTGLKIKKSVEI